MVFEFYRPLEERVAHLPGVQAAGFISILPSKAGETTATYTLPAAAVSKNKEMLRKAA